MTDARVDADAFNAFEAAGWERQAAGYEDFFGPITTRLVEPLLDAAGVGPGDRVLDVASGPGYVAAKADERGASAIGVDVAEAMVSLARRLHPQLEFRRGNAEALPFPDESFDAALGNFVMLHLGRPEQAVAEFVRVLAPSGRLALTVWDVPERARFLGVLLDSVAAAGASAPAEIPVGPPIFRFSDEQEFARLLGSHGLEATQVRTIAFSHRAASPDELWRGLLGGSVRTSALILRQTADMQREIRAAFDRIVQEYQVGDAAGGSRVREACVRPEAGCTPLIDAPAGRLPLRAGVRSTDPPDPGDFDVAFPVAARPAGRCHRGSTGDRPESPVRGQPRHLPVDQTDAYETFSLESLLHYIRNRKFRKESR